MIWATVYVFEIVWLLIWKHCKLKKNINKLELCIKACLILFFQLQVHSCSIVLMAVAGPDYQCLHADVGNNGRISDGGGGGGGSGTGVILQQC